jgi:hypothetical protein
MKHKTSYLARYLIAPVLFLTVALTAGIRFQIGANTFQFVYPPLISCIVGALGIVLLVRWGLPANDRLDGRHQGVLDITSRLVLISAIYLATAQVFSLVTPEHGLLSFFFNAFYLLILLNDLFVVFNPRKLAGALAVILGASFMLKYVVMADVFAPATTWGKYILQELLKTGSLGVLDQEPFAPSTGYLAFVTVGLYVLGLYMIAPSVSASDALLYRIVAGRYGLTPSERIRLATALASLNELTGDQGMYAGTALTRTNDRDLQELNFASSPPSSPPSSSPSSAHRPM